jgi:RNA polymerase sigma-70 factor (ECF subfamily)
MEAYDRYGPALLRKAQRVLGSSADAEDVVQGLFVDLIQKGEPLPDLPYLYRAVTNRCLTLIRDRDNRQRLLDQNEPSLRGPVRTRFDERAVGIDLLAKLADRLDTAHLETLVFRYFDDLSLEEIADVMDVSRKTVGNRLARVHTEILELSTPRPTGSPS